MTVASETSSIEYAGNGSTTAFSIPFGFLSNSDIQVSRRDSSGDTTILSTGFTVTGAGTGSGTCTFTTAPASGTSVVIERAPEILQPVDYVANDRFPAETHEGALDRLAYISQYLYRLNEASIRFPTGDAAVGSDAVLPAASSRKGKLLYFDATNGLPEMLDLASVGGLSSPISQSIIGSTLYPRSDAEIAASVTPTNYYRPYGSILRYGADPTGSADSTTAINNALLCNPMVFDDYSDLAVYKITGTLRFQFAGQIFGGRGCGDANTSGIFRPRTSIKYAGVAGGKMVSVYPGTGASHMGECQLRDMLLDGDALASKAFEGYDDSVTGGCWRNGLYNVTIRGCTSGTGYGMYLGAGTGNNNANDMNIENVYVYGCETGVVGGGATIRFRGCTFQGNNVAGASFSAGATPYFDQCVFTGNAWDILATSPQLVSATQCWFENSTSGIYKPTTAHSAYFSGCYLHTSNATRLLDWNSAAGNAALVNCTVSGTTSSAAVTNHNASYEYDYTGTGVIPGNDYRVYLPFTGTDRNGLAYISQAKFMCGLTSDQTNATGDGTAVPLNASAVTEAYDLNGALAASTGIFTAPASGYYQFDARIGLGNLGAGHTDAQFSLVVAGTSAQTYAIGNRFSPGAVRTSGNEATIEGTVEVFMTKNDTAYLSVTVSGSTKTVTVQSGGTATNWRTRFAGRLV